MNDETTSPLPDGTPRAADRPPPPVSYKMTGDLPALFAAKAKARLAFGPIVKNREVTVRPPNSPEYKFTYATLDAVREATDKALAEQGLDLWHLVCTAPDGERELHTFLTHANGGMVEACVVLPKTKMTRDGEKELTIQELGSAQTYWMRYSDNAILGVAAEHDDDGNAANGNEVMASKPRSPTPRREPPAPAPKAAPPPAAKPQEPPSPPPAARTQMDPGTGEAISEELSASIRQAFKDLGYGKGPQPMAICRKITGKPPEALDAADGLRLLAYLKSPEAAAEAGNK